MGYEQEVSSKKKLLGFILVLLFHIVLIYALITGLAQDFVKKVAHEALEVSIIEEVKLPPPPPPPPPKETAEPQVDTPPPPAYVPPAEVKVQTTDTQNTISAVSSSVPTQTTIAAPTPPAPAEPSPPAKPHIAVRTKASLNSGCARPSYPAESIDMEEEGQVTLGFQIDVDGHVVESKILKSSGFTRLDDAARDAFSKCEFTPATVDGVAEKSLATVPFEWKIK